MKKALALVVTVSVLAAGMVPAMAAAQPSAAPSAVDDATLVAQQEETMTDDANETNESGPDENATENASVSPGAKFAGVIGAQEAEFKGEMEQRAFGHQVAAAATNGSKAQVLAHTQERLHERLNDTDERLEELKEARDNGNISESRYQAEVTALAAETETVRHMGNSTERAAAGLPAEVLEQHGVNVTAIQMLQTQAHNMTGHEVSQIARSIAGPEMGQRMGPPEAMPGGPMDDRPGMPGMPGDENQTDDDQAGHGHGGQGNMTTPDDETNMTSTTDAMNTTETTSAGDQ